MRKLFLSIFYIWVSVAATAQAGHLVISQVYGGGGNNGAPFKQDFVELFNPTSVPVSFSNWSLQYASAGTAGAWSDKVLLSGTVPSGGYFLIQLQSGTSGADIPTPDVVDGTINLSAAGGKLALVNHATTLTGACPTNGVIDLIGYGTSNCSEGSNAPSGGNTIALLRSGSGCVDKDVNSDDFSQALPNPHNSTSPVNICISTLAIAVAEVNAPYCIDVNNGTAGLVSFAAYGTFNTVFTVELSDPVGHFTSPVTIGSSVVNNANFTGAIPVTLPAGLLGSSGYKVRIVATFPAVISSSSVFFEVVNGMVDVTELTTSFTESSATVDWKNPPNCFDEVMIVAKAGSSITSSPSGDGTAYVADPVFTGAGSPFDGGKVMYKGTVSGQQVRGLTPGTQYFLKIFTRRGSLWSQGIEVSIVPRLLPQPGEIVINQLSPGYNSPSDEYIELVNKTNHVFNLDDLGIRYQSASGSAGLAGGNLSGTLLARQFWLLSSNASVTVGANVGTPRDGSISAGMAASAGQVALVRLSDNVVIDAVGYGTISGGSFTETAPATPPPANSGLRRRVDGDDSNNNNADFEIVANSDVLLRTRFNSVLPVHFEWVRASTTQHNVQVQFRVTEGKNVVKYLIERSIDGRPFIPSGSLEATAQVQSYPLYLYTEPLPFGRKVVYRIQAIMKDEQAKISNAVALETGKQSASVKVRYNSNKSSVLLIQYNAEPGSYQVILYNMNGHAFPLNTLQHTGGLFEERIPLTGFPRGLYVFALMKKGEGVVSLKMIGHH